MSLNNTFLFITIVFTLFISSDDVRAIKTGTQTVKMNRLCLINWRDFPFFVNYEKILKQPDHHIHVADRIFYIQTVKRATTQRHRCILIPQEPVSV